MTVLAELLEKTEYEIVCGDINTPVNKLEVDSRKVTGGDMFICVKGATVDGHTFIDDVINKGAKVIVVEKEPEKKYKDTVIIKVKDTKVAMADISAAYFGYPAKKIKTIGITGTKGKTTTAYMVYEVLKAAKVRTGLIGTIETIIGDKRIPSVNTTPDAFVLQKRFKEMVEAGIEAVVMEVSSQGLMLHRVGGFEFDYGVFTNLGKDHIGENEHKDFDDYKKCKAMLFKQCKKGIINIDDKFAQDMIKDAKCEIETFGINNADLCAKDISLYKEKGTLGISYTLDVKNEGTYPLKIDIPGLFNVYNSLTAIAICRHFVSDMKFMESVLKRIRIKGRAEIVETGKDFTVMIDYAHNAMSLESLLLSLKEYNPKRIVTVFGCGGNRDRNRRFEMGEVSSKLADLTIITSDNPRHEKPADIMEDIITGVKKASGSYVAIEDRQEAINYAIEHAQPKDVIVIAGKGHEDYQIIGDVKYHMDDRELVENATAIRQKGK